MSNYFTEMCSDSVVGSCLRLIDFVQHSTLGVGVIQKKKENLDRTIVHVIEFWVGVSLGHRYRARRKQLTSFWQLSH